MREVADPDERWSIMKIPATMHLADRQIDRLIRNEVVFQRLMRDLEKFP